MSNLLAQAQQLSCNIIIADLFYNPISKQLISSEGMLDVEPRSIELLEVLLSSIGEPVSGDEIIQRVWESEYISKNVLTNRISTLRALFKQHSRHPAADKVIVTYPKKGYYLQTDLVSLDQQDFESDFSSEQLPEQSSHQTESLKKTTTQQNRTNLLHLGYLLLIFCILIFSGWFYGNKQGEITPTIIKSELETRATVPVVDILLNTIKAKDAHAQKYLKEVKALALSHTLNYPYVDLKNQDSPTYFLDPIDDSIYWPGGRNVLDYDYKLNLFLSETNDPNIINIVLELIYQGSNKLAFKSEHDIKLNEIKYGLHLLAEDVSGFLSLPKPEKFKTYDQDITQQLIENGDQLIRSLKHRTKFSRFETEYIARQAFLSNELSPSDLLKAIDVIESSAKYPTEEIGIWLGLLHYKLEEYEQALEYLNKDQAYNKIHNAFLYLVLSNMALKRESINEFRLFYLKSIEALSEAVSSEEIFKRLAQPENKESCFAPWQSLTFSESNIELLQKRKARFVEYCEAVAEHLAAVTR
ncbi:winged helix-turn-helix domain-containing protein [Litoribacillus peritrichatus]|uniref:Winged helix-turn-helix domain-containing protein n=1 Tax=Litoribacillus peritrichatus TaxID=718191 RepID=A0ABP7MUC2_9GAMM